MFASSVGVPDGSRRFVRTTVAVSMALHIAAGATLLVASFWKISRLAPRAAELTFVGGSPAPLGEPAAAAAAPEKKSIKREAPRPDETVQPTDKRPEPAEPTGPITTTVGTPDGVDDPTLDGPGTGTTGDGPGDGPPAIVPVVVAPDPVPQKKDPPPVPAMIDRKMIEGQRIAGTREIQLPDRVVAMVQANGISQLKVMTTLCIDESGQPSRISVNRSSGFADVDAVVKSGMSGWRYRPWMVNGQPARACFGVVFNYKIMR
jgi:hypothetical protein